MYIRMGTTDHEHAAFQFKNSIHSIDCEDYRLWSVTPLKSLGNLLTFRVTFYLFYFYLFIYLFFLKSVGSVNLQNIHKSREDRAVSRLRKRKVFLVTTASGVT